MVFGYPTYPEFSSDPRRYFQPSGEKTRKEKKKRKKTVHCPLNAQRNLR